MSSTFYSDGYRDAVSGYKFSPPAPYRNHNGVTTVYADEYQQGYAHGVKEVNVAMLEDQWNAEHSGDGMYFYR